MSVCFWKKSDSKEAFCRNVLRSSRKETAWQSAFWKQEYILSLWCKLCHYISLFLLASYFSRGMWKLGKGEMPVTVRAFSQILLTSGQWEQSKQRAEIRGRTQGSRDHYVRVTNFNEGDQPLGSSLSSTSQPLLRLAHCRVRNMVATHIRIWFSLHWQKYLLRN